MIKIYHSNIVTKDQIEKAEKDYKFQEALTNKLDEIGTLTELNLLEIVLWKTNRYPEFSVDLIRELNDLKSSYSEEKAKNTLKRLLGLKGFDLPMASTVLRFLCPKELQIIDQRVYRIISESDELHKPYNIDEKVKLYFDYITRLKEVCKNNELIPFDKADRILYQLDKNLNSEHKIKY